MWSDRVVQAPESHTKRQDLCSLDGGLGGTRCLGMFRAMGDGVVEC